jgi:hypothetical protein
MKYLPTIGMSHHMERFVLALGLFSVLIGSHGCKKQASDNDAVRAGIMQHLNGVGTLNMRAMEMDIRSVSVTGNQAHAEVEFRAKTGAPPGAGMQVTYNLEKRNGAWVVLKSQPAGGMIQHPDPSKNPHQNPDMRSGNLPNFRDILTPPGTPAQGPLPPGHPPVDSQPDPSQTSAQDRTPTKKP